MWCPCQERGGDTPRLGNGRVSATLTCPLRAGGSAGDLPDPLPGLMLQDLVSAKLLSDYTIVEIPDSVHDLRGTDKVRGSPQTAQPAPSALSRICVCCSLRHHLWF